MPDRLTNSPPEPVRILLAEDDDELRFIISYVLAKKGFDVEEVSDGKALERRLSSLLRQSADERGTYVVVSDIYMPGGTAIEVIGSLGRGSGDLPIILITSDRSPEIVERAEQLGIRQVLAKPFDLDHLAEVITQVA